MTSTDSRLLLIFLLVWLLVGAGFYVWYAWALSRLFKRLGTDGWRGWVPVLNEMTILERGGVPAWNIVFFFFPVVNLYGLYLKFTAVTRIGQHFGRGTGVAVLGALMTPVWATMLVLQRTSGPAAPQTPAPQPMAHRHLAGGLPSADSAQAQPAPSAPQSGQTGLGTPPAPPAPSAPPAAAPATLPGPSAPQSPQVGLGTPPAPPAPSAPPAAAPTPASLPAPSAPQSGQMGLGTPPAPPAPSAPPAAAPTPANPAQLEQSIPAPGVPDHVSPPAPPAPQAPMPEPAPPQSPPATVSPDSGPILVHNPWARPTTPAHGAAEPAVTAAPPPNDVPAWLEAPAGASAPGTEPAPLEGDDDDDDDGATVVVDRRPKVQWHLNVDDAAPLPLVGSKILLGRRPTATAPGIHPLAVPDTTRTLSKAHAQLELNDGEWSITDLNSTNGVLLVNEAGEESLITPGEPVQVTGRFILGKVGMHISFEQAGA